MLPCADHFEDLIGYLTGRAIGRDANKARYAAHPLALVGGVTARAEVERLDRLMIAEPGDLFQAERLAGGCRDRPGERPSHFVGHPRVEHRLRPRLDPAQQLGTRNVEAEDRRGVAGVGTPEPVGGRLQGPPGVRELERTHDPPAVVWM